MLDTPSLVSVAAMVAALAASWALRDERLTRTSAALLVNWLLCSLPAWALHIYAPPMWFLTVDAVTAWVVLWHPSSKTQALIGVLFIVQIALHSAFIIAGHAEATGFYLDALSEVGRLQLLVLWGGGIHGHLRRVGRWPRLFGHRRIDLAAGQKSMEGGG